MIRLLSALSIVFGFLVPVSSIGAEAEKPQYRYTVSTDLYGMLYCFHADAEGIAYGLAVDANLCGKNFLVVPDIYGANRCFHIDDKGRAYGMPASDSSCSVGHRIGTDGSGGRRCFNTDKNGIPFGAPVDDNLCAVPKGNQTLN